MKILSTKKLSLDAILKILRQERSKREDVRSVVAEILEEVKNTGDKALFEFSKKFDGINLESLSVSESEIKKAYEMIPKNVFSALVSAKKNIEKFHRTTFRRREPSVETVSGVKVWCEFRPIERIGLYIPGGKAAYPSTVLMLGVPAKIAGCTEVVLCVPCTKDGSIDPSVLVAADLCGVRKIYKIGGAQAIAAMAYGTETVPKVSKIFGPGNQYVTTAKMMVYGEVNIDMPAGPSEVAVIADETANASWIAADLLSQLEHGEDSQALLVTPSLSFAEEVVQRMQEQMSKLSRKEIIQVSFRKSFAVVCRSFEEICFLTNEYAPEHLEIVANGAQKFLRKIKSVGSVFLGKYTSEPLGDYATGANHTLPTSGFAKMFSPLSTESFGKMIQIQKVSKNGLRNLKETVEILAAAEGLDAHKNAISIRFQ